MEQVIRILGHDNVNFIKARLQLIYEDRGSEWEGDFMAIPSGKMEIEDKLPNPVLDWFDTVIIERSVIHLSAKRNHETQIEEYPNENEISRAFKFEAHQNIGKTRNGDQQTLIVSFYFDDKTIMQVFGITE